MKKATLETIRTILTACMNADELPFEIGTELDEVLTELTAELNKGAEAKAKNAKTYEALHDYIVGELTDQPCTVAELWDIIKDDVPTGTTKGKVQYALTHLWQDEIVKVEGKPNGYRKA